MAVSDKTFGYAGGAVSDIFAGEATSGSLKLKAQGNRAEASEYDLAASMAIENERFSEVSAGVKEQQLNRGIEQTIGGQQSDIAGAGFGESGTALDLMRDSASQGAIAQALLHQQGLITEDGYREQAISYGTMANAAREAASSEDKMAGTAETNGWITGGIKAAAAIATFA